MSNSRLSLIFTCLHMVGATLLFMYIEELSTLNLGELGIFFVFGLVITALVFAIKSRWTTLGMLLLFANSIFLLIWLALFYFMATFTLKL